MYCKCECGGFDQITDGMLIMFAREMKIISLKLFWYFLWYREPVGVKFRFAEPSERFGTFQVTPRAERTRGDLKRPETFANSCARSAL